MSRKHIDFTIDANNRDKGKTFRITEMSATDAEMWATDLACALIGSGVDVPNNVTNFLAKASSDTESEEIRDSIMASGMIGLAKYGITALSKVGRDERVRLSNELMRCVQFVAAPNAVIPLSPEIHIEEPSTLFRLKVEALKLHLSFLNAIAD
ncbi:hypothetical protein AMN10_07115 [Klebsiella variicola]|nr:hypothetical protein [Klebsiella variicola]QOV59918.1 hypothetical protein AMN10_07115 [Klebsiella variicola]CEP28755.1 conserved hypothetical protein [Klebsiella variicola]